MLSDKKQRVSVKSALNKLRVFVLMSILLIRELYQIFPHLNSACTKCSRLVSYR